MTEKIAIFSDFDNTISTYDVCVGLFDAFSWPNWREIEDEIMKTGKGSQVVLPTLLAPFKLTAREMKDFVLAGFELDPYFSSFVEKCEEKGWPLFILSDGLDFYLQHLLAREGLLHLNFRSNKLEWFGGKPVVSFPFQDPTCGRCGHCKRSKVEAIARQGYKTIYIGDGISDYCAAQNADLLFAKDDLLAYCQREGIPHRRFDTFADILKALEY